MMPCPVYALLLSAVLAISSPVAARSEAARTVSVDSGPGVTALRFETGLALLNAGRPRAAAAIFANILSRNPDLVRVRLELARAYFDSGQWRRARAEFLSALSGDIPEPVRANILSFIRAIDSRRGFEWDADVAVAQLGNTRDYESDTLLLDVGGGALPFTLDRDPGTVPGLRFSFSAALRRDLPGLSGPKRRTLGFARTVAAGDEGPGSRFDDLTLTAEAGARFIWPRSTLTVAPLASRRFLSGSGWEDRVGFRATFGRRYDTGATLAVSLAWHGIDHRRNDSRDGQAVTLGLTATRPVSPRASLGARLAFEDKDVEFELDAFQRFRLTAFGAFDVGRGITLKPSAFIERKLFDNAGSVYVESLDETGTGAALTVESSRIILANGFTPYATVTYQRVKSGARAYSWRDINVTVGVERRF